MINLFKKLTGREYTFLNRVEISREALISNYQYLSKINPNIRIAPVLKSNAYGHGLVEIAQILDAQATPFYCVDSLHEAYHLYKANIKTPILIMGYFDPTNLRFKKLPFSYAVWDLEMVDQINRYQKGASVHIKVDTGMNRLGVRLNDLDHFIKKAQKQKNIKVGGVMSHLASANSKQDPLFLNQLDNFKKALQIFTNNGINPTWRHLGASQAILNASIRIEIAKVCNLFRAGISLYGIADDPNLKPVLSMTTKIAQIKKLQKGDKVGYDGTFTSSKQMTIGIIPVGYNDGVDRRLSDKGYILVNDIPCRIIGRVSMNITTIDITQVGKPYTGQEVTIFSDRQEDPNSIFKSAQLCGTIPYELLVHLVNSTKREITD